MTIDEYENEVERTSGGEVLCCALGIAGEAGEVADLVKKAAFHEHPVDQDKLAKELGDVLWYVTAMALSIGVGLDEVMARNVAKLRERYPDGFDPERSKNRPEGDQ